MKLTLILTQYMLPDGTIVRPDNIDYFIEVKINKDNSERIREIQQANLTPVFMGIEIKGGSKIGQS